MFGKNFKFYHIFFSANENTKSFLTNDGQIEEIRASDPEGDPFQLRLEDKSVPFELAPGGQLKITGLLDRETKDFYQLTAIGNLVEIIFFRNFL